MYAYTYNTIQNNMFTYARDMQQSNCNGLNCCEICWYHTIMCVYIYTQYVLCSRVQHLGLMIAGVTTSCQLHQLGNGFFTTTWGLTPWAAWRVAHVYVFHGIKLGGLLKKPWVSPKKSRTTWMIPGFFSHRKASNMWSNSRYVTHWSWSNMASRKLRKRPWCLRLSTGRWRRACILSCRIRGLPFR